MIGELNSKKERNYQIVKTVGIKKAVVVGLMTISMAVFGGCAAADQNAYIEKFNEGTSAVDTACDQFQTDLEVLVKDVDNAENKQKVLDDVDAIKAAFEAIEAIEAPKKFAEAHDKISASVEEARKGCEIYSAVLSEVSSEALSDETKFDKFVEDISEGDTHMDNATELMEEAVDMMNGNK